MSFFNSLSFLLITAAWIAAYLGYVRWSRKPRHEEFLLVMSLWWTHSFFGIPLRFLCGWLLFLCGFYFLGSPKEPGKAAVARATALITFVLFWWGMLRFPQFFGDLGLPNVTGTAFLRRRAALFVGVPFTACRLISFVVDSKKGQTRPGLVPFLLYISFFPSRLAGPVAAYNSFIAIEPPVVNRDYVFTNIIPGIKRIILGIFKRQLLANFLWSVSLPFILVASAPPWRLLAGAYAYYFYLFMDFSGYTDLALGISKIMNVNLPENFNFPFFARNPRDFWQRWHISFLEWLNQYVMTPLYSFELRRLPFLPPVLLSLIAILVTFVIAGIWHGEGLRYVFYGVLNALIFWGYRLYDETLRRRAPALRKRLLNSSVVTGLSIALCFHYVVFALMVFSLDPDLLGLVLKRLAHG